MSLIRFYHFLGQPKVFAYSSTLNFSELSSKVKIFDADRKVIEKFIGRKNAIESCDKKGKKTTKASLRKTENDNLSHLFKTFPLFGTWPQVLKRILLVSIS